MRRSTTPCENDRPTTFMSRVLDLSPSAARHVYDSWVDEILCRPQGPADAGRLRLAIDPQRLRQDDERPWRPLRSATGTLHTRLGRSLGAVCLELHPWSERKTELGLRLVRRRSLPNDRYFAVGHAALTQLTAELTAAAGTVSRSGHPLVTGELILSRVGAAGFRQPLRPVLIEGLLVAPA